MFVLKLSGIQKYFFVKELKVLTLKSLGMNLNSSLLYSKRIMEVVRLSLKKVIYKATFVLNQNYIKFYLIQVKRVPVFRVS